jgi:acyl-CoA reductase-like NAD-dependent aldehyde dehydrogenase
LSKGDFVIVIEEFVQKTKKLKVGDPLSEDADLGPIVNASGLKTIDSQRFLEDVPLQLRLNTQVT